MGVQLELPFGDSLYDIYITPTQVEHIEEMIVYLLEIINKLKNKCLLFSESDI